ncbi:MAG: autophagy protein atg9 [Bogoriella megaspora]|nr:MAG: autophagy protein atg9 [Bogoriella megaspora]
MREDEARSETSDRHDPTALDEANLEEQFHDQDIGQMLNEATESQLTTESTAFLGGNRRQNRTGGGNIHSRSRSRGTPKWMRQQRNIDTVLDEEEDVPESLLLEDRGTNTPRFASPSNDAANTLPPPVPGPYTTSSTGGQQNLRDGSPNRTGRTRKPLLVADPKEKAMWRWVNVLNLDNFLNDVYTYYTQHGIWSMLLARILNLFTVAFVCALSVFLFACVDYSSIPYTTKLSDAMIPQCTQEMSGFMNFIIWIVVLVWVLNLITTLINMRDWWAMHEFYTYLLGIPDSEIQTVSWPYIVQRLMALRDSNPITAPNLPPNARKMLGNHSKQRMDAHDIANRLMRRENYLIALFNKEILDFSLPLPFLRNRQFLSNLMMWNVQFVIMDFLFDRKGHIKPSVLRHVHRKEIVRGINNRLLLAAWLNFIAMPFVVLAGLVMYFYTNFLEFKERPSQAGAREWTSVAKWKFREFNELPHLCEKRFKMAYPFADAYLEQFPKDKTAQVASFIAFVSGALAAVLGLATLLDPELFLRYEITHDRNALFYITILTAIFAASRNAVPEETFVSDPELHLREVIERIHYKPSRWEDRLHSVEVRNEFASLYQVKPVLFLEDLIGNLLTPFILLMALPKCSERIVDFFREFTLHVDGIGYVCSFAVFDFQKGTNTTAPQKGVEAPSDLCDDYYSTKDGKMLTSYYGFMADYGTSRSGRPTPYQRQSPRKSFRPPPNFPGLGSPESGMPSSRMPNRSQLLRQGQSRPSTTAVQPSPVQSLVLDPHHQPPGLAMRQSPRVAPLTASRAAAPARSSGMGDHPEESRIGGVAINATGSPRAHVTSTQMLEDDSKLGESWTTERPADGLRDGAHSEDDDDDDDPADEANTGAGVLGLLYQFQKAHTGGRNMKV